MSIFIILCFLLRLSTAQHDCTPTTCSDHGPTIRFPFRLKNHHPHHCGYPGFDLSCSPNATHLPTTTTVLDLPNSVKVLVSKIDYKSRLIHIEDPNSCFPQHLQNLNLSATHFEFAGSVSNFSLFSCPSTKSGFSYRVTCLSGNGREVYAEDGEGKIYYAPPISCRKMYTLSVPSRAFDQTADLQLKWPKPDCGKCEAEGKFCRIKSNSTSDEFECFGKVNPPKQAIPHSEDHKPNRIDERKRIESAGGVVMWAGTWRVGGVLAMSRAFGNRMLKQFVVAEPEIQDLDIDEEFEVLVLASDGLWDVVPNEDAVALAQLEEEPEAAARKLTETAFTRGSADNITCIVVKFHHQKANPADPEDG